MNLKALLPLVFLLASLPSFGQRVTFTNTPAEFNSQLDQLFVNIRKPEVKAEIDALKARIASGSVPQHQLNEITTLFNAMLKKKLKASPVFTDWIKSHNNYWKNNSDSTGYKQWFSICENITQDLGVGKSKKYKDFLGFSLDFFNDWRLAKIGGKFWYVDSCKYDMAYHKDSIVVKLDETTISGFTKKDTVQIANTNGTYLPLTKRWSGKEGKVDWKKVGPEFNALYCELKDYAFDLDQVEYVAKDVLFFNEEYFDAPLRGDLIDRIGVPVKGEYKYPRFESYKRDFLIDKVTKNVELTGGFGQHGSKTVITGTPETKAKIKFVSSTGNVVLNARSPYIAVKKEKSIYATDTEVSLYFAQDSIYHPGLNLGYLVPSKELRLVREEKATSQIAFMDSYHKLELGVDALLWSLDSTYLELQTMNRSAGKPVTIESYNYYDPKKLNKYKVVSSNDPVTIMKRYFDSAFTRDLPADDLAKMINGNYTVNTILNTIFELVKDGFIYYNPDTQMIYIRQKVIDYIDASKGEIDFDNLKILSHAFDKSIRLDLEDFKLGIKGVEKIVLSDSQSVAVFPYRESFEMKEGRDMDVHGDIVAGRADFINANFKVDYDAFKINIDSTQKLLFYLPQNPEDDLVEDRRTVITDPINTVIEDLTGVLSISPADNKSGRVVFEEYPSFETKVNSYIYYENEKLFNGAYNKSEFYFKLDPFTLEHMDELTHEDMSFPGIMVYGDIFPKLENTLTLQADRTLGFESYTAPDNTPMYAGKNVYSGTISLDNRGLTGSGRLNYLAAEVRSNNLVFLPDSTFGRADTFLVKKSTIGELSFPNVTNNSNKIMYYPYADSLIASATRMPFNLFEGRMTLDKDVVITSKGMFSSGTAEWDKAKLQSELFTFSEENMLTDSTSISIKTPGSEDIAFNSYHVSADIQAYKEVGRFQPHSDTVRLNFNNHNYFTSSDDIFWDYGKDIISIDNPERDKFMFSEVEAQKGFKFKYEKARYDLNAGNVSFSGVDNVVVADVSVVPHKFEVELLPGGEIQTFENAVIYVDTTTRFHEITNANVDIISREQFFAQGDYNYKSPSVADQTLRLDSIYCLLEAPEKMRKRWRKKNFVQHTIAKTSIPEDMGFKLNKSIEYKGACELDSKNKFLNFIGYAQIDLITRQLSTDWFGFEDEIDPNNISLFVDYPYNDRNEPLYTGFSFDYADLKPYSTFLQAKESPNDLSFFDTEGVVDCDAENNIYKIGPEEVVYGAAKNKNLLTIYDKEHKVEAQGRFNMSADYGLIAVDFIGKLTHEASVSSNLIKVNYDTLWVALNKAETDSTGALIEEEDQVFNMVIRADSIFSESIDDKFYMDDMLLGVDFEVDKDILEVMYKDIREMAGDNDDFSYNSEGFINNIGHLVDEKEVDEVTNYIQRNDYFQRPKKLKHTLLMSNIDFIWDKDDASFHSVGKIELSHIGEGQINRMVDGFVEFTPRKDGDTFSIYFEFVDPELPEGDPERTQWYFYEYRNSVMSMISSNASFNEALNDIKPNKRQKVEKKKDVEKMYQYTLSTLNKKDNFVYRMQESLE